MFKEMSETVSVGMVVADMNVPGCPLAYINEGFKTVTGEREYLDDRDRVILHELAARQWQTLLFRGTRVKSTS